MHGGGPAMPEPGAGKKRATRHDGCCSRARSTRHSVGMVVAAAGCTRCQKNGKAPDSHALSRRGPGREAAFRYSVG